MAAGGVVLLVLLSIGGIFLTTNASRRATQTALAAIEPSHTPRPSSTITDTPAPPTATPLPTPTDTQPPPTPTPTLGIGSTFVSKVDGITLLFVPAGEFLMGSIASNNQAYPNEKPQHSVFLDAFWIDRTEVTNAMYQLCVQTGACQSPGNTTYYGSSQYDNYPVVNVSWNDAKAYCGWAGGRLPSEAQWEKAARGTDGRTYPWGEGLGCEKANYSGCVGQMVAVGSYPDGASPYGALDMAGNEWEWVADWFSETYYSSSPPSNPQGPESGKLRVLKGGSYLDEARNFRAAVRNSFNPDVQIDHGSFRCAR